MSDYMAKKCLICRAYELESNLAYICIFLTDRERDWQGVKKHTVLYFPLGHPFFGFNFIILSPT
jgi:hypothetical protein